MILVILILFLIILFLILLIPIKISIIYNRKSDICINYLFFKINLFNKKSKKQKKTSDYNDSSLFKKVKRTSNSFMKIIKNRKIIIKIIKEMIKNINFEKAHIELEISSSEAKDCAMNFYFIRTFIYYFINLFEIKNNIKSMDILIFPSFLDENLKIRLNLEFKFIPILIIYAVIKSLITIKIKKN